RVHRVEARPKSNHTGSPRIMVSAGDGGLLRGARGTTMEALRMASPASSRDRAIAVLICLIGLESCGLGIVLLIVPRWFLRVTGFPTLGSDFFPSQSGVFLLILEICYLFALSDQAMIKVIVISKLAAVI